MQCDMVPRNIDRVLLKTPVEKLDEFKNLITQYEAITDVDREEILKQQFTHHMKLVPPCQFAHPNTISIRINNVLFQPICKVVMDLHFNALSQRDTTYDLLSPIFEFDKDDYDQDSIYIGNSMPFYNIDFVILYAIYVGPTNNGKMSFTLYKGLVICKIE